MLNFQFDDPKEFLNQLASKYENEGYSVEFAPNNVKGYDLKLINNEQVIAVQVKNYRVKVNVANVQKFLDFMESALTDGFTEGWLVSTKGYTDPAMAHVETEQPENIKLATAKDDAVHWNYPESTLPLDEPSLTKKDTIYIGVFTCKGGVGKTTVSAHLGGAFALMGYDVILLDLDPDRNLRKLFLQNEDGSDEDAGIYVPGPKGQPGATISVLYHKEWDEANYPDVKLVICDCSPVLHENPTHLVQRFDYCIIPTTLNPLGVSKNGDVIVRTFKHIREYNTTADMFALINGYNASRDAQNRNSILFSYLKNSLSSYLETDPKCKLIDPEAAKIRQSNSLLFWGLHIIEGTRPQLAFREVAGKSHPRLDFLQLADYLENHTDIDELNKSEK